MKWNPKIASPAARASLARHWSIIRNGAAAVAALASRETSRSRPPDVAGRRTGQSAGPEQAAEADPEQELDHDRPAPASIGQTTLRDQLAPAAAIAAVTALVTVLVTAIVGTPITEVTSGWFADHQSESGSGSPDGSQADSLPVNVMAQYATGLRTVSWVLPDQPSSDEEQRLLSLTPAQGQEAVTQLLANHQPAIVEPCVGLAEPELQADGSIICSAATSWLAVTVVGLRDDPVLLTGMRAVVQGTPQPPLTGTFIQEPGGGPFDNVQIMIDLDSANRVAQRWEISDGSQEPYFQSHSVTLARGEPIRFIILASTDSHYYEWKLGIEVMADGASSELVVGDPQGDPFRTTAVVENYRARYHAWSTDTPYERWSPPG